MLCRRRAPGLSWQSVLGPEKFFSKCFEAGFQPSASPVRIINLGCLLIRVHSMYIIDGM
jgi:hypothetical protein